MPKSMLKKHSQGLCLAAVLLLAGSVGIFFYYLHKPLSLPTENFIYEVKSGSSLGKVSRSLAHEGVLDCSRCLLVYARLQNRVVIKAGEYALSPGTTPVQLLEKLNRGNVIQHQVTLVEGRTFRQGLQALWSEAKLEKKLTQLSDAQIRQQLGITESHLEGLFFPDSYSYTAGISDADILRQAYQRMQEVLEEEWEQRDANLPYKNIYEVLIMASIVEKETGAPEERPAIAGVFIRRLQKGMKLQTDPTVIYGLGDAYRGNITRKHLQHDNPYNTYTRYGLPPTPIALPGREAIHAALHPLSGDDLFFVGKGDGHHYFSATLAEHEKAVREYQLQRKKDYHSAPAATDR